jgi:hypothetical protein
VLFTSDEEVAENDANFAAGWLSPRAALSTHGKSHDGMQGAFVTQQTRGSDIERLTKVYTF